MKLRFTTRATKNLVEIADTSMNAILLPRVVCVRPSMKPCKT